MGTHIHVIDVHIKKNVFKKEKHPTWVSAAKQVHILHLFYLSVWENYLPHLFDNSKTSFLQVFILVISTNEFSSSTPVIK